MKKIIFIDLDGTLTDSKPGVIGGVRYAAEAVGATMPPDDMLNCFIGPPLTASFEKYLGLIGEVNERALKAYREYYVRQGEFENSVYDGVEQMLERLKAVGCRLYVVTAKPEVFSKTIITHFGLDKYFDQVCGASMDKTRNNKKAVIRYAIEESKVTDLSEVVMVGDRSDDILGAKSEGLDSIGILYGYGSRAELEESGADWIAATPAEVAEIIIG